MDVTHPGSKPLDADQLSLLETFRGKVDSRITNHGLTAADVQMFVDEIKKHPDVSVALLRCRSRRGGHPDAGPAVQLRL